MVPENGSSWRIVSRNQDQRGSTHAETCHSLWHWSYNICSMTLSKMPWHEVVSLPTCDALYQPTAPSLPREGGNTGEPQPKATWVPLQGNSTAILEEGSAGAAFLTRPCTLQRKHLQFAHLVSKSHPPTSMIQVFVVHKYLLTPISAPITQAWHDVIAFYSLQLLKRER